MYLPSVCLPRVEWAGSLERRSWLGPRRPGLPVSWLRAWLEPWPAPSSHWPHSGAEQLGPVGLVTSQCPGAVAGCGGPPSRVDHLPQKDPQDLLLEQGLSEVLGGAGGTQPSLQSTCP